MQEIHETDTIAAIATARGAAGVCVVRISGAGAVSILERITHRPREHFADRRMVLASIKDTVGQRIDDALCVVMRAPHSFTGEDVVEIHGHGGVANAEQLIALVIKAGARPANPGEFSRRALENGRMDLLRIEALLQVVNSDSARALRIAQAQLGGALTHEIERLIAAVVEVLAQVEAAIDFPEEGIEHSERARVEALLEASAARCKTLAASYEQGRVLRDGIEVVIRGPVNAGKSALFNRLLGHARAIVNESPGTTRDFLEARCEWQGVRVTLIDTAGERDLTTVCDAVEAEGIARGRERAAGADFTIRAIAPDEEIADVMATESKHDRVLWVLTKADIAPRPDARCLETSAMTGFGIEQLRQAIVTRALGEASEEDAVILTSERQRDLFRDVHGALSGALAAVRGDRPIELAAADLSNAHRQLAMLLGREVGDEVLDSLFHQFCIGK